jgi:hypothetical protein
VYLAENKAEAARADFDAVIRLAPNEAEVTGIAPCFSSVSDKWTPPWRTVAGGRVAAGSGRGAA